MRDSSHGCQLVALGGGRMEPSQRLHICEVGMLRRLLGQGNVLIGTNLRDHHDRADLLDHWIVWRTHSIHVASDLGAQVSDADKALEHILGQNVGETDLSQII